ncbi:DUF2254 domain-containing protein [Pseudomonas borbori]
MLVFESTSAAESLRDALPPGLTDVDNGRELLGTLITSIISLTVFSFSMVMVVLNGAAARLTPRVLPRLISDIRNRVILGIYLGSVLYYLVMITTLKADDPEALPTLGLLLALLFGMLCLAMFVVFIRSVSQSIQVDWVLSELYDGALENLARRKKRLDAVDGGAPDDADWWCIYANRAGYLREVNERPLGELLREHDLVAVIQVDPGFFIIEGHPLIKLSAPLDEKLVDTVRDCFDFHNDEFANANISYGMRQISEIAVKAISPAINDPGMAARAINLLGVLLLRLSGVAPIDVGGFDQNRPRLFYPQLKMQRLLELVLGPIRNYGRGDPLILTSLLQCLKNALHGKPDAEQLEALVEEIEAVRESADLNIENQRDRLAVNHAIERINQQRRDIRRVPLLSQHQ